MTLMFDEKNIGAREWWRICREMFAPFDLQITEKTITYELLQFLGTNEKSVEKNRKNVREIVSFRIVF